MQEKSSDYMPRVNTKLVHCNLNFVTAGFICVREMSGKLKKFQGQGIVREFYVVSVKNGYLLKCQGNVREFCNLYQLMRNRKLLGQFS